MEQLFRIKNVCQQSIKLIANNSLFTKGIAYFISVLYLLYLVLKHATNIIRERCKVFG